MGFKNILGLEKFLDRKNFGDKKKLALKKFLDFSNFGVFKFRVFPISQYLDDGLKPSFEIPGRTPLLTLVHLLSHNDSSPSEEPRRIGGQNRLRPRQNGPARMLPNNGRKTMSLETFSDALV